MLLFFWDEESHFQVGAARSDFMESTSSIPISKIKKPLKKTCKNLMMPKRSLLNVKHCIFMLTSAQRLSVQHLAQFRNPWQQNLCLTVFCLFGLCGDVGDDAAQQGHWKGIQDLSLATLARHPWQTRGTLEFNEFTQVATVDTAHLSHPVTIAPHFPVPLRWASQDWLEHPTSVRH